MTAPFTIMFNFLSISTFNILNCKILLAIQTTADFKRQRLPFHISLQSIYSISSLCYRCTMLVLTVRVTDQL